LPVEPYVFAEWRLRRVGIDYHVDVDGHFYSVPHRFARAGVEVRFTACTVEIFAKGERIAAHMRSSGKHKHSTIPDHVPSSHRRYALVPRQRLSGTHRATAEWVPVLLSLGQDDNQILTPTERKSL
jgi:transposase